MAEDAAPEAEQSTAPVLLPTPPPAPQQTPESTATETSQPFGPTSGIGSPIPIPKKQVEWESGYQNEHGPRPSRWESWVATPFEEGAHATVASPWGGAVLRMLQDEGQATGKSLSAEQANQLYPGRPVPYTTPVDQGTALMEYNDRQKQQQLSDWAAQRPQTTMGKIVSTASGFVGGMTDPLNFAIGAASSGLGELLAPEGVGLAGKLGAHYLSNLGGFSAADALQNLIEHGMGAKRKQLPEIIGENAVPAAVMTGIGVGMGYLARRFMNEGGGTSEADIRGTKETVAAMEQDRHAPALEDMRRVLSDRRAGQSLLKGPAGSTVLTSPLEETPLYAANHSDGTPLVHEHGLGPGIQLTDSHDVANNGVSRSTETPGQIRQTKLPEGTKLLNLDQAPGEPEAQKFLEEVAKATGTPPTSPEASLKEVIANLGDWAGTDLKSGSIPDDILKKLQAVARALGYDGYQFNGTDAYGDPTSRQVHLFDTSNLSVSNAHFADPTSTPQLPDAADTTQALNPEVEKTQNKFYSPEVEKQVHEARKSPTFDTYSPEFTTDMEKEIESYKQQLTEMSKTSDTAKEALEGLRRQEAQDARLRDIAKRVANCAGIGGV